MERKGAPYLDKFFLPFFKVLFAISLYRTSGQNYEYLGHMDTRILIQKMHDENDTEEYTMS
jgi:hypothetical protein